MKKLFIYALVLMYSLSTFSAERTTLLSNQPRYLVSHEEADLLLTRLKVDAQVDIMKVRPKKHEISQQHGGIAKEEEDFSKSQRSCWADENQFHEIQKSVLNPWMKAWLQKDESGLKKHLLKNAKIANFVSRFEENPKMLDDIRYYENWNRKRSGTSVSDYLNSFKMIEDFDLITFKYASRREFRDESLNMLKAELHIQYDLRGITTDGFRRNDRGPLKVVVVKGEEGWKIEEISDWGLETVMSTRPAFKEVTADSGVLAIPEYQRVEAIRRGGYAIAIGDVNNDGNQDMYLGAYGPGKLLLGNSKGQWVEARDAGLEEETLVKTAAFADFNNDGHADLLLTRFVPTKEGYLNFKDDILIYKNLGKGRFEKMKQIIVDKSPADNAMPAAVADFNNDGLLDFYVGFPGTKDFTTFGKIPNREDLRVQGLYMNKGGFKFSEGNLGDYSKEVYNKVTLHQRIFPHSSVALDFDQDGDMDIVVIDDRGNISPAYRNDGKGGFSQAEQYIGVKTTGFGMGLAAADIDNNGILDMVFTNVNFTTKVRTDNSCQTNWNAQIFNERDHGLKFYYGMQKGKFAEATMKNGLFYAGEGLAGAEFLDYNNDGYQDLYVTNGLWSGTDKYQDLTHIWARSFLVNQEQTLLEAKTETQSTVMKILMGFTGDIYSQEKGKDRPGMAGYQRNRLFRNLGDGNFIEVGYVEGVDSLADGYVISKVDMNGDGSLDLVLRNGDPGSKEVNFPAVQVFENTLKGNSLRLKLIAKSGNRDAIGSSVIVKTGEMSQVQQLINNNGTAQSEKILHFGLNKAMKADLVVVTWPSGKKTTLKNLKMGAHVITEGADLSKAH